jgi:NADP-dependent 3-hydroxy acid dehydrogenase YdfG
MVETAIVVGASSGIGRATALALAAEGVRVMAAARREEKLRELHGVETCATDVTDRPQVERLISTTLDRFGKIDLLVYATGENIPARAMKVLTPEIWDMMLAVNLTGAFNCTHAVLGSMRAAGGGLIVYISTISVHDPDVSGAAYQASKHGISGLAHATRLEEKQNGIRTSVIFPGLCRTGMVNKRPVATPKEILDLALEPEDVAEAVVALARLNPRAVVPEMELVPSRL